MPPSDLPPLWAHQADEIDNHWNDPARALLWSMRTGKSRAVVQTADKLHDHGLIDCVVILAPKGVNDNWTLREIPKYSPGARALAWSHPERDEPWFAVALDALCDGGPGLRWLSVNSEALQYPECRRAIGRFVRGRRFLLVADESDDYGAPGSGRSRFARALARRAAFRRILTGTVVEDSPLKAFSQYEILERGALGFATAEDFNAHFAEYEQRRRWIGARQRVYPALKGYRNLPELRERMARLSSVVLRSDCSDMPELLRVRRSYRPSRGQLEAYESLRHELSVDVGNGVVVTVVEAAVRLEKLRQILGGYVIDGEGKVHDIPGENPRLDCMSTEVLLDPGQVIVACRFREDVRRVTARLREDGHEVVQYLGGMTAREKNHSLDTFQAGRVKAFVCTPIRGLELSAADTIVWYSHIFWAMLRRQMDERATKMGGTATAVVDIVASGLTDGIDGYTLENQDGKRDMADDLARGGLRLVLERMRLG